jgi:Amt family ammonium transporter
MTWIIIEGVHQGKMTALGFASGVLAGLVAVTPAAGVVKPAGAMALAAITTIICYVMLIYKDRLGFDDSLDAFGIHGLGGIVGALGLTFFIRDSWMEEAAVAAGGTWSIWQQFSVQLAAVGIAITYAIVITVVILYLVEKTVGLKSTSEEEMQGLDHSYHGERGYGMLTPN